MGCRFCASTLDGWERNLLPSEMLDQIYTISRLTGERVSNVVVMGTGEPMDNYDNLLTFIRILTEEHGLHISQRNITVSTCGIVPKMKDVYKRQERKHQGAKARVLRELIAEERLPQTLVARKLNISPATFRSLQEAGLIAINSVPYYRNPVKLDAQREAGHRLSERDVYKRQV